MKITISKADMMRGQTIPPTWYKVEVTNFVIKPPKSGGDSLNYVPTFKFEALDGYTMDHTFNSQAIGNMGPFIAAIQGKNVRQVLDEMKSGTLDFETDTAIGKKLQVFVKHEEYQGRMVNRIEKFLPYDAQVPF